MTPESAPTRRLLIVGAGGFGRELESWLDSVPDSARDWRIHGYLDDNAAALHGFPTDYEVVGGLDSFEFRSSDLAILAIGVPEMKRKIVAQLEGKVDFLTFLGPGTRVGKHVRLGRGTVVGVNCVLTTNIESGDFVTINSFTAIGHDVRIGAYASFMGNVMVNGGCSVGEAAYIGSSASLIPRRRVGEDAVVGAGAVVFRHVAPGTTVLGNPAKVF